MIHRLLRLAPLALLLAGAPPAGRFEPDGRMRYPEGYREWQFVTAGHGMSYDPAANAAADAPFDNVFVNPAAYAAFKKTGHWPDDTVLVLEIHGASTHGSINKAGAFQSGGPVRVEVHVRDRKRFGASQDGWAFFAFDPAKPAPATKIAQDARCYACHAQNGAVDRTFVQFYPTLLPIARAKHTLAPGYSEDAAH